MGAWFYSQSDTGVTLLPVSTSYAYSPDNSGMTLTFIRMIPTDLHTAVSLPKSLPLSAFAACLPYLSWFKKRGTEKKVRVSCVCVCVCGAYT